MTDDDPPDPPDAPSAAALEALEALMAVAARLAAAERLGPTDAEPGLRAVADAAAAALRVTAASIALHDPLANRLVFRAAAGPQGQGVVGLSVAANEGIAGYAFATGQPLAIADVRTDPRFELETAERTGYVPRSLLAVPLVDDDGIIGVMEWLDRLDGAPFDLGDLDVATRVAAAATATARATWLDREAGWLLRRALEIVAAGSAVAAVSAAVAGSAAPAGSAAGPPGADAGPAAPRPVRSPELDAEAIEALVAGVATELAGDDPLWRLADRVGRLRAADPDDVELVIDWLDALLARSRRRSRPPRR